MAVAVSGPVVVQGRWRPGSRVARLRASHSYRFVLLLVFASFVFCAAAPNASWASSVLILIQSLTLATALWTSGLSQDHRLGLVVVAIAVVAAVCQLLIGGDTIAGAIWLLNFLLVAGVVIVVGLGVVDQGQVNRQSVTGAICIYLELGMLFTFVYGAAAKLGSGPFFAQGTDGTTALRLYFSYVTLATLGYGDYTPSGDFGHTLAISEALLGQLYLVTVVALLVSNLAHRRSEANR
jgi:Ion channel